MPTVTFRPEGLRLSVPRGTRLVDAIRRVGLPVATACGDELVCAKCGVRILTGKVKRESAREREVKQRNRIPPELRLACTIRIQTDLEVTADYWGDA
jgi:ferredoxin